mmetsp:Transcript_97482/g.297915  ORF Transcript_97482/g.297915 Transcript_97482/m.297915 type:complete len:256 (+) Transcript_97482:83-850(+)
MSPNAAAIIWDTSSRERQSAFQPSSSSSSSSLNMRARSASRSGRYSTSIRMTSSCHKLRASSAGSATRLSRWSPSKLWSMAVHRARSGRRQGYPRSRCRSTCTTSRSSRAIAASRDRLLSAASWTSLAASAGRNAASCATCGARTMKSIGLIAARARTTSGPLCTSPRRRAKRCAPTWSTCARIASACGPSMQKNCSGVMAWPAARCASGSGTPRCTRRGIASGRSAGRRRPGGTRSRRAGRAGPAGIAARAPRG